MTFLSITHKDQFTKNPGINLEFSISGLVNHSRSRATVVKPARTTERRSVVRAGTLELALYK